MTRILVIEDSRDLRDDVIEMLTLEGFEAAGAENGLLGLEAARTYKPDLIVCDIMMPEMDGYTVLENLRKNPVTATIPFIFLTARTDRLNVRQGMVLGADDYLTKPFPVAELLDSIHSQLKKRAELNHSAERRMNELRENIITALPHELRTPLNTIIGFSDMLLMEAQRIKPDQIADWATHINEAAQRLYRLVENYLFYARLQVAAVTPATAHNYEETQLYDTHVLVETMAHKLAQKAGRPADLRVDLEPAPGLRCSHPDLVKMMDELMDNAFKFSEPDTPVTVRGFTEEALYTITIADQGRGFHPEQLSEIGALMQFERWFYEQQGMGLGLVIVQHLASLYGARFHIDSQPGQGAQISLSLRHL
ncbi:MAG: response regulator [Anaerolineae bacterium]|nr:response regulator [Anaerolineae bacterium]